VVRDDHLIVPRGDTRLAIGDEVLVLVTADAEDCGATVAGGTLNR
jgi:Trk K+ transport system NAD-binding subunit